VLKFGDDLKAFRTPELWG